MPRFVLQSRHSPDECRLILQALLHRGAESLLQFDFACAVGDGSNHIAYATVEAESAEEVIAALPAAMRAETLLIEVARYSPEQVRTF